MTDRLTCRDLDAFDFELPPERIAQQPLPQRDAARLLCLDRSTGARGHRSVRDLPELLEPGDLLVMNATRVLTARLRGRKETGGQAEALLLGRGNPSNAHQEGPDNRSPRQVFRALVRCGGKLRPGQRFFFEKPSAGEAPSLEAELLEHFPNGEVLLAFPADACPYAIGEMPLPPYIRRAEAQAADEERYQTVFAKEDGSVAAPTAGLHFTSELFAALDARGIERADVILHVGAGTFRPLSEEQLAAGKLHSEFFELPAATAEAIARTRERGGRIVAVGTTSTRVLETCVGAEGKIEARSGSTDIFIYPGVPFRAVDGLLTNFHLPKSSLLLLVAAFAGREQILEAYAEALAEGYRFFSYGDAMLIL